MLAPTSGKRGPPLSVRYLKHQQHSPKSSSRLHRTTARKACPGVDVVRRTIPGGENDYPLNRRENDRSNGHQIIYSRCHGLTEDAGFVCVACSCCLHLHCTMGVAEDPATRGGRTRVTCPNPAGHSERREILLLAALQQIREIGLSGRETDRDTVQDMMYAAESPLGERIPPTATVDSTRDTTEKGEADAESKRRRSTLHRRPERALYMIFKVEFSTRASISFFGSPFSPLMHTVVVRGHLKRIHGSPMWIGILEYNES